MVFNSEQFLPYLLNRAAEHASRSFQSVYKSRYGMLRTEWRVLFHLGVYEHLTASQICEMAGLHKTKVSRAVAALQEKRLITKRIDENDRRFAPLILTAKGKSVFADLSQMAEKMHHELMADFTEEEQAVLLKCLHQLRDDK